MDERIRVTVETPDESTSEQVFDSEGEVEAGGATFRFSVGDDGDPDGDGDRSDGDPLLVAPLAGVPSDSTIRRTAMRPDGRRGVGVILRRDADSGEVFAWRNSCPHNPEVPLDPGRGARVDGDEIVCHEHGARFECGDGLCTWGPCVGEELDPVGVEVRDGAVYLDDERFASVRPR
ncbi:Rieske (2Fe-2S) protein [Halobaculum rarum]|uniref:Rieske (2Fe-2S) protein n=1 Tax=Halobaculum rarum TaxID=3075122 RepID=UPI0032AEFCDE